MLLNLSFIVIQNVYIISLILIMCCKQITWFQDGKPTIVSSCAVCWFGRDIYDLDSVHILDLTYCKVPHTCLVCETVKMKQKDLFLKDSAEKSRSHTLLL